MASVKLTKLVVEAAAPSVNQATGKASDTYLWDTQLPRFGVRITPPGVGAKGTPRPPGRIYLVQYRARPAPGQPPKTRRITIGLHGKSWTVETARAEAKRFLALVDLGRDPFADREDELTARQKAVEAAAAEASAADRRQRDTFRAIVDRYVEVRARKNRSWAETERLLRFGDAGPKSTPKRGSGRKHSSDGAGPMRAWGDRHISDVCRSDVADLMDTISKRSPAVARATYAVLRGLFAWCVERDLIQTSPCGNLKAPPRPEARDRVLADTDPPPNRTRSLHFSSISRG
jgi:hypothetical protein